MAFAENLIAEDLGVEPLTEFLSQKDHNLMLFASSESRRHARKLANNLGVDLEPYVSFLWNPVCRPSINIAIS